MSNEHLVTLDVRQQMFRPRSSLVPPHVAQNYSPTKETAASPNDFEAANFPGKQEVMSDVNQLDGGALEGKSDDVARKERSFSTEVLRDEESILSPTSSNDNSTFILPDDEEQLLADDNHVTGVGEPPAHSITEANSKELGTDTGSVPAAQKGILKLHRTSKQNPLPFSGDVELDGKPTGFVDKTLEMPEMLKQYYDDLGKAGAYQERSQRESREQGTGFSNGYPSHITDVLTRAYIKLGRIPFTGPRHWLWLKTLLVFLIFLILAGAIAMVLILTVSSVPLKKETTLEINSDMWGDQIHLSVDLSQLEYNQELNRYETEKYTSLAYQLIRHVDSLFEHSKSPLLKASYGYAYLDSFSDIDDHVRANLTVVLQKHSTLVRKKDDYQKDLEEFSADWKFVWK